MTQHGKHKYGIRIQTRTHTLTLETHDETRMCTHNNSKRTRSTHNMEDVCVIHGRCTPHTFGHQFLHTFTYTKYSRKKFLQIAYSNSCELYYMHAILRFFKGVNNAAYAKVMGWWMRYSRDSRVFLQLQGQKHCGPTTF